MDPLYIIQGPNTDHNANMHPSIAQIVSLDRNGQYVVSPMTPPSTPQEQDLPQTTADARSRVSNLISRIPLLSAASKLAELAYAQQQPSSLQQSPCTDMVPCPTSDNESLSHSFTSQQSFEERHEFHHDNEEHHHASHHSSLSTRTTYASRARQLPISPPCSRATSPPSHIRRRKPRLSRKHIDAAVRLSNEAIDEDRKGSADYALDCYLSAIEYMLNAIPQTDLVRKQALKQKVKECMERLGLTDPPTILHVPIMQQTQAGQLSNVPHVDGWSEKLIGFACAIAVTVKQSPLPHLAASMAGYTVRKAAEINAKYHLHEQALDLAARLLELLLDLDKKYHLHEQASQMVYIVYAAIGRAIVAYGQAEGYDAIKRKQAIEKAMVGKAE